MGLQLLWPMAVTHGEPGFVAVGGEGAITEEQAMSTSERLTTEERIRDLWMKDCDAAEIGY